MKVFLIGSDRRIKSNVKLYRNIADTVDSLGIKVDRNFINASTDEDRINFAKAYKRNLNSIKLSDIVIAEISDMSSGVGFLIPIALSLRKPVLALYKEDSKDISATIMGSDKLSKGLFYKKYSSKTLKNVIQNFLNEAKDILDTKFILIISPEIDHYLEWAADFRRMHKAQIVRNAVEKEMENDEDYQNFLKEKEK